MNRTDPLPPSSGMDGLGFEPVAYNHAAELAAIGALLLHGPEALPYVADVEADDFSPDNGHLWAAAHRIAARHHWPDLTLLASELGSATLRQLGDTQGLVIRCMDAQRTAPVLTAIAGHVELLRNTAHARRLQATALELVRNPANGHATDLVDRLNVLRDGQRTSRLSLTAAADVDLARPTGSGISASRSAASPCSPGRRATERHCSFVGWRPASPEVNSPASATTSPPTSSTSALKTIAPP